MKERSGRERMKQRERLRGQRVKERQWLRMVTMTIVLGGNSLLLLLVWRHWSLLQCVSGQPCPLLEGASFRLDTSIDCRVLISGSGRHRHADLVARVLQVREARF